MKPQILLLGVAHFEGSSSDLHSTKPFDALAAEQQRQVEDSLDHLAEFRPNKIAVEAPFGSVKISSQYQDYLQGHYAVGGNEIDQIGYQLARMLGHHNVYPIDYRAPLDFDALIEYSREHGQEEIFGQATTEAPAILSGRLNQLREVGTLRDELRYLNTEEALNLNLGIYMVLTRIGTGPDHPGADLTAEWYKRNLIIFSNLTRIATLNGDRVLVILGQGHIPPLKQFIQASPDFDLVSTSDYL